jgi:hypothetical protein
MLGRLEREKKTVEALIKLYCYKDNAYLCKTCKKLLEYAKERIDHCPYGVNKPTCADCSIHCYSHDMKHEMLIRMRETRYKMLFKHPVLTLLHVIDHFKRRG